MEPMREQSHDQILLIVSLDQSQIITWLNSIGLAHGPMEDKSHDIIWYINSGSGTRASVSHLKLHCSLESVDWKNFIIFSLQPILVGFILAYYIGK